MHTGGDLYGANKSNTNGRKKGWDS